MRFRRGLSSRVLSCGCLVGLYETYDEAVVAVIDVRHQTCGAHVRGAAIDLRTGVNPASSSSPADLDADRTPASQPRRP
jgi:hypothetical protein